MLFKMTEPEAKPISPPRSELTLPCRDARGSPLRLGLGDEIWQGHILVTGGTGSGKTTVIRQLLARCRDIWPEASFIVLDVKGDYIPYRRPGDKVFSFYGSGEDAFRWNILEEARASPHPEDELDEMVSVLFASRVNTAGQNRFFVDAARQIFYGYLLVALRQCRPGRPAPTHAEMASWLKKCTLEQMQDRLNFEKDELGGVTSLLKGREAASILSEVHLFAHDFFRVPAATRLRSSSPTRAGRSTCNTTPPGPRAGSSGAASCSTAPLHSSSPRTGAAAGCSSSSTKLPASPPTTASNGCWPSAVTGAAGCCAPSKTKIKSRRCLPAGPPCRATPTTCCPSFQA